MLPLLNFLSINTTSNLPPASKNSRGDLKLEKKSSIRLFIPLVIVLILTPACEKREAKRVYTEIHISSAPAKAQTTGDPHAALGGMPMDEIHAGLGGMPQTGGMSMPSGAAGDQTRQMLEASVTRPPLSWKTPQGWQDQGAGGMRLASFTAAGTAGKIECAVISLAGMAGGVESNTLRWMGQIGISPPPEAELKQFLSNPKKITTQDGFPAAVIDLTQLQASENAQAPSMMAAIIELPAMTVFVKMTGSRGAVLENKDRFEALCESLKLN